MRMDIDTPYPIEGTVKYESENVTGWLLPCPSEWLSEHEAGDIKKQIRNEMQVHHEPGVKAEFIVYESGAHEILEVSELEEAEVA